MRLKFPDMTRIHAQFENPLKLKMRAHEISNMAYKIIKKVEDPLLFKKIKNRIVSIWN